MASRHDHLQADEVSSDCIRHLIDVLRLMRFVDGQCLSQLIGVEFDVRLYTFRLVVELSLHRLEVLHQARLGLLSTPHDIQYTLFSSDLRSFEIRFEFKSDDSDSI